MFNPIKRKGTGLIYQDHTSTDFDLNVLGGFSFSRKKLKVPTEPFNIHMPIIHNQGNKPSCVGQGIAGIGQYHEKVDISGNDIWERAKELDGNESWGTSLLQGCKAAVKFGLCEYELNPENNKSISVNLKQQHLTREQISLIENNRELHKQKSYFKVNLSTPSKWDNFLVAMDKFKEPILTGLEWFSSYNKMSNDGILPVPKGKSFGHCVEIVGLIKDNNEELRIDLVTHFGNKFGAGGHFYMNKEEVDRYLYPSYIILDIEVDLAKVLQKYESKCIKLKDSKNCYLVKDGHKYHLLNEHWASSYGIVLYEDVIEIPKEEFDIIPKGKNLKIEEGKDWEVIRQSLLKEKIKISKVI